MAEQAVVEQGVSGWHLVILPDSRLILASADEHMTTKDIDRVMETFQKWPADPKEIVLLRGPLTVFDLRREGDIPFYG